MDNSITITDKSQLRQVAQTIINTYPNSRIFGFYGEMGAGKTTLIKEICSLLNVVSITSSPTFAIVNEYLTSSDEYIYHFDFYRIENIDEAIQIGLEDYLNSGNYCFIEWIENIDSVLNNDLVKISITVLEDGSRIITY